MSTDESQAITSLSRGYVVPEDVISREIDGETVILDLKNGTYFGLDSVGTRVWQLVIEHGVLQPVLAALVAEFEADPEAIRNDLLDLVAQLERRQLLRPTI